MLPDMVLAWERGQLLPSEQELTALAAALWCAPADLLGAPTTLREYRWSRGLALEDVAFAVGLRPKEYARLEDRNRWTGDARRTAALAEVLGLSQAQLVAVTGRAEKLAEYLRSAASVRWQPYVKPVSAMVTLPRERIEHALSQLHEQYQSLMTSTLSWSETASPEDKGAPFLAQILDHFWQLVE
ncbi:helix-turn-helix domain-containing protein [Streptomyces sp. RPT161]|uniref:helix-turn-helix domain-containing protein n=1 Tax=Streptomyces sp. RPT161 TaxID=3015993 RepID=UPI0022B8F2BE|nr:helix-turn-helix transcriptional regulator [Streptomyces sp. RPT161]